MEIISGEAAEQDFGWGRSERVPDPGFGFFPPRLRAEMETGFWDFGTRDSSYLTTYFSKG